MKTSDVNSLRGKMAKLTKEQAEQIVSQDRVIEWITRTMKGEDLEFRTFITEGKRGLDREDQADVAD